MFIVPANQIYEAMTAFNWIPQKNLSPTEKDNLIDYFLSFLILHITIPHAYEKGQLIASNKCFGALAFNFLTETLWGRNAHRLRTHMAFKDCEGREILPYCLLTN